MATRPIQNNLLTLFEQTRTLIQAFVASRSAEERAQIGTDNAWSAKDVLSNAACWMDYMVQRMEYFARNEPAPLHVDFDAIAQRAFLTYQHQPWQNALNYLEKSLADLISAVQNFSEDQLSAYNTYDGSEGGPLWGEIRANGFISPLQQLEKYYRHIGDSTRAADIHARLAAVMGEESPIVSDLISPAALAETQKSGAPIVIDVRGAHEYAAGHIPGAIHIPLAELAQKHDPFSPESLIITYCNMHHPGNSRSEQAASLLAQHGFRAAALEGGFPAWKESALPVLPA